jgi:predicted dehydrogenase
MAKPGQTAFEVIDGTAPKERYRGAVVGCGRMGSTIDDEHIGMPHYPWPWAHAPAMIEARGIDLVTASDDDPDKLEDFRRRWDVSALYPDYREMVAKEQPDVVCLTTRPEPRAEITVGLAELGVKAIFATKPMCRTLAEADAMIEACAKNGTILTMACHLNWYSYYTKAREMIEEGVIGELRSMVCDSPSSLSNIQSHSLSLLRLFADSPAMWVVGLMNSEEQADSDADIPGSGIVVYENGVQAFLNSRSEAGTFTWSLGFIGKSGRIATRTRNSNCGHHIHKQVLPLRHTFLVPGTQEVRWWMPLRASVDRLNWEERKSALVSLVGKHSRSR